MPSQDQYRRKVELFIHDGKGNILASKTPDGGYRFPGGGVDPGESINAAAKREALEEVAWAVKTPRAVPKHKPETVTWDDAQRKLWGHKGRSHFAGTKTYRRVAEADKKDKTLYGADDDTLKVTFEPISAVLKAVEKTTKMPKSEFTPYHHDKAQALRALQQSYGAMRGKTARHAHDRLTERTSLPRQTIDLLEKALKAKPRATMPKEFHVPLLQGGNVRGYAAIKRFGVNGAPTISTVLAPHMSPSGKRLFQFDATQNRLMDKTAWYLGVR